MLGSDRGEALWRIVAFAWAYVAGIVAGVLVVLMLIQGVIDVLWQLAFNRQLIPSDSSVGSYLSRILFWPINNLAFALLGRGNSVQWLP